MAETLGPLPPRPRMVAGVSGGPHSLALLLLLRGWGADVRPLIIDHGLRPESGQEADHVAAMVASAGLAPRILRLGLSPGSAVQERARQARLVALATVAAEEGRPWIALGHHAEDQAETVLLRLQAHSGPAGLAGMAASRPMRDAMLIRPLLGIAPARLEAVVRAAGLVPVRDPSNTDRRFARIRARAALSATASATLRQQAEGFAQARADRERAMADRLAAAAAILPEGYARLCLRVLGQDQVAEAALGALIRVIGGGKYAPAGDALRRLLTRGFGSLGGVVLGQSGLLWREVAALAKPVPARAGAVWDGRWRLDHAAPGCVIGAVGSALRPRHLPARVAAALPGLWRDGTLVAVPALGYAPDDGASRCRFAFEPGSGPIA